MQLRLCMYTHVRSFRKWCHGAVRKFFPRFPFLFKNLEHQVRFDSRFRDSTGKESCYEWNSFDSFDVRWMEEVCFRLLLRSSQKFVYLQFKLIYIYYNFGYIVKFHLVGFCQKRFVVESFDRSRVRVWMQSWKFFVTGRIDVVRVFFPPLEMQEQRECRYLDRHVKISRVIRSNGGNIYSALNKPRHNVSPPFPSPLLLFIQVARIDVDHEL